MLTTKRVFAAERERVWEGGLDPSRNTRNLAGKQKESSRVIQDTAAMEGHVPHLRIFGPSRSSIVFQPPSAVELWNVVVWGQVLFICEGFKWGRQTKQKQHKNGR